MHSLGYTTSSEQTQYYWSRCILSATVTFDLFGVYVTKNQNLFVLLAGRRRCSNSIHHLPDTLYTPARKLRSKRQNRSAPPTQMHDKIVERNNAQRKAARTAATKSCTITCPVLRVQRKGDGDPQHLLGFTFEIEHTPFNLIIGSI